MQKLAAGSRRITEPTTEADVPWTKRNADWDRARALRALNSSGTMIYAIRTWDGLIKMVTSRRVV